MIRFSTLDGVFERDGYFQRIKVVPIMRICVTVHEKSSASVRTPIAGLIGECSSTVLAGLG